MDDTERYVLTSAAAETGRSITIHGSTAADYVGQDGKPVLIECIPPLGDLDIKLGDRERETTNDVGIVERLRTELPAYRFIHIDIAYAGAPVATESALGNVILKGLPEVKVTPDGELEETSGGNIDAKVEQRLPATLFRDFLFLLRLSRRYPALERPLREVAQLLWLQNPLELGRAAQRFDHGRELVRLDKALTQHVLLKEPQSPSMTTYLPLGWLLGFRMFLNHISRNVIAWEQQWLRSPAVSYGVNGIIKNLMFYADAEDREFESVRAKADPQWELGGGILTPLVEIDLPKADDPACCEYMDFSHGISELAFGDASRGPLLDLVLMEGRGSVHIVHALSSSGRGVRSLRTDPGFMSILATGWRQRARLFGVNK